MCMFDDDTRPWATSVWHAHLLAHLHVPNHTVPQGVKGVDVDLPTMLETHIVVGTAAKLLYTVCYMVLYSVRPLIVRPKAVGMWGCM